MDNRKLPEAKPIDTRDALRDTPTRAQVADVIVSRWAKHDDDCPALPVNWPAAQQQAAMAQGSLMEPFIGRGCTCGLDKALEQWRRAGANETGRAP